MFDVNDYLDFIENITDEIFVITVCGSDFHCYNKDKFINLVEKYEEIIVDEQLLFLFTSIYSANFHNYIEYSSIPELANYLNCLDYTDNHIYHLDTYRRCLIFRTGSVFKRIRDCCYKLTGDEDGNDGSTLKETILYLTDIIDTYAGNIRDLIEYEVYAELERQGYSRNLTESDLNLVNLFIDSEIDYYNSIRETEPHTMYDNKFKDCDLFDYDDISAYIYKNSLVIRDKVIDIEITLTSEQLNSTEIKGLGDKTFYLVLEKLIKANVFKRTKLTTLDRTHIKSYLGELRVCLIDNKIN